MNGELLYVKNPWHSRIKWAILYSILIAGSIVGLYVLASRIQTHSLPVGQVQLSTQYSKYLVGEPVTFTLKNNFNSPIYVTNQCPSEPLNVYRKSNASWVRIHEQAALSVCPSEQRQITIPAYGEITGSFAPWQNLFAQPGVYRIVAYVQYYNALPYQDIQIVDKPKIVSPPVTTPAPSPAPTSAPRSTTPAPQQTNPLHSQTVTLANGSVINVEYNTSTVYVMSVVPSRGCTYSGGGSGAQVTVTFICNEGQTQIRVILVVQNGQFSYSSTTTQLGGDN